MSLVPDEGRQKSMERHQPFTQSLHAKESQLQALHSEEHRSRDIEAAIYLLPSKVNYLKGKEGSTLEHTDRHLPFTAQGDPELTVRETP